MKRRPPMGARSAVEGEHEADVDADVEDADEDEDAADSTTRTAAPHATTVGRLGTSPVNAEAPNASKRMRQRAPGAEKILVQSATTVAREAISHRNVGALRNHRPLRRQ